MKLLLYDEDLRPEHANINCSATRFEHFNDEAQAAIKAVRRAKFVARPDKGENYQYNAIHAPKNLTEGQTP